MRAVITLADRIGAVVNFLYMSPQSSRNAELMDFSFSLKSLIPEDHELFTVELAIIVGIGLFQMIRKSGHVSGFGFLLSVDADDQGMVCSELYFSCIRLHDIEKLSY